MKNIPDWLARLPADAYINSKEIVKLFGYSEKTTPQTLIKHGSIPPPSSRSGIFSRNRTLQWKVKDIRRYLRESKTT